MSRSTSAQWKPFLAHQADSSCIANAVPDPVGSEQGHDPYAYLKDVLTPGAMRLLCCRSVASGLVMQGERNFPLVRQKSVLIA